MKIGRLLKKAVRFAKNNPEIVLSVAGVVAPKLVTKVAGKVGPLLGDNSEKLSR